MQSLPATKYRLKDLHREIDFFDRKIAYSRCYEKFDSDLDRESAVRRLITKRGNLVKMAAGMVSQGIEYDPGELPRSFKNGFPYKAIA